METLHERHRAWWKKFWSVSEISLDDPVIEQRYYLSKYMLASVARDPEYPPNILGISTFDRPAWNGNYKIMVNTVWAVLIPGAFNVWNMILARTYYQSIPAELREASAIDGANEIQHFFKIMMPVCKPIIAVLALWSFVGMWNSYFDAMIYLNDANLQPLQLVLRSILVQNTPQPGMIADIQSTAEMAKVAEQLKYATIVVSSLPLLVMYPFFQKYFDEGIMVGSVKG